MAHRLVEQDSGPAGAEDHGHGPGGGGDGLQIDQGLVDGLAGKAQGSALGQEVAQVGAGTATAGALLPTVAVLDDDADAEADQGPDVGAQAAVITGDEHQVTHRHQAGDDLPHPRVLAPGLGVDPVQQGDLVLVREAVQGIEGGIKVATGPNAVDPHPGLAATPGDGTGRLGGLEQGLELDLVGIGKAGLLPAQGPQAGALLDIEVALLDDAVLQHPGLQPAVLKIDIRGIDSAGLELAEEAFEVAGIEAGWGQDLVAGNGDGVGHSHKSGT